MMRFRTRYHLASSGLVLLLAATGASAAPYQLRFGYLSNGSLGDAAEKDAAAALSIWGKEISSDYTDNITPRAVGFPKPAELAAATLSGEVTLMLMDSYYYLTLKSCASIPPTVVQSSNGTSTVAYVVLVRRKAGIHSLAQLSRRTIEIGNRTSQILPAVWLDTALHQNKLPAARGFFRSARNAANASKAMLDVFFGSADACVVTTRAFAQATELNPQLGQQLQVLKTSGRYLEQVACISPRAPQSIRKTILAGAFSLHRKPRGRQILALFGNQRVVPYQPAVLNETRSLIRAYQAGGGRPR